MSPPRWQQRTLVLSHWKLHGAITPVVGMGGQSGVVPVGLLSLQNGDQGGSEYWGVLAHPYVETSYIQGRRSWMRAWVA